MKKKLLFLTETTSFGGAEKHLIDLILRLDLTTIDPIVVCFGLDFFTEPLIRRQGLSMTCLSTKASFGLYGFLTYLYVFIRFNPHVIVFVKGGFENFPWYAYVAAKLSYHSKIISIEQLTANVPPERVKGEGFFNNVRKLVGWRSRYMFKNRLRCIMNDMTVCVSLTTRERLISCYGYPRSKTIAILNSIDLMHYSPSNDHRFAIRAQLGVGLQDIVLVCMARLAAVKRIDVLLDAIHLISGEFPSCKCIIVGNGPLREELIAKRDKLMLEKSVLFVGFAEDVRPYLETSDIFVLSSDNEGFSFAVLEAMAYGLPCIVTNVGGNNEAVIDKWNGITVNKNSAEEFAKAIRYLLSHEEERVQMGLNAKKRVYELSDIDRSMEMLKNVLLS